MPLTTRTLVNLVGLNTEASPVDPQAMPPNSLYDCRNAVFSKAGQLVARKGQVKFCDLFTATDNFTIASISPIDVTESGSFFLAGQFGANGGRVSVMSSLGALTESAVKYFTGTLTGGVRTAATATGADHPEDLPDFGSYTPRYLHSQNRAYLTANNGLFRQEETEYLKRVTTAVPVITNTGASDFTSAGAEEAWFPTGYSCRVVCVLVEYFENGSFVESPISSEYVFENVSFPAIPQVALKVDCHNIRDLSRTYFEVYRTRSYKFGSTPETDFKKCRAITLDNSSFVTIVNDVATISALPLPANDDLIASSESLYASPNGDGGNYYVNCPPPVANDALVYKDYTVYAGLRLPPYVQITATGFGAGTAGSLQVRTKTAGTPTVVTTAMTLQENTAPGASNPSTTGQMTAADYTVKGFSTQVYNVSIRPMDPSSPSALLKCHVPYYAVTDYKLYRAAASDSNVARLKPSNGKFDLSRFPSPKGCFAVVESTGVGTIGVVRDIVTYDDYEQIPGTNGLIEFYGAQSKANFDATGTGCWDATSPTTTGHTYYLYPLATADTGNLPLYPISTDATVGNYDLSFSLLPTYYQYPDRKFMEIPVGVTGSVSYDTANDRIQCRPTFFGLLWKDVAVRLDRMVKALVQKHNSNRTYKSPYMVYTGEPLKFLAVGGFAGSTVLTATEADSGNYDAIYLNTSGSTITFDENITTSPTNFSEDVDIPNGLIFSKKNRPECVPLSAILAPEMVGQDTYRIQRLAVNNDQLYVFKDREGIFRVQIVEGTVIPTVAAISVVDNTIWLVGDDTLQELQESIIFLTNKGVIRLNNGQLSNISRSIESLIKDCLARESNPNNIKSFRNEYRRHYGIYFPTADKCFVFDTYTEQWSIWDTPFTAAYGRSDGRLMLAKDLSLYTSAGASVTKRVVVRESYAGGGWDAASDQYDLAFSVTTPSTGNTAVFTAAVGEANTWMENAASISTAFDMAQDKVYYKVGSVLYPMTYVSSNAAAKTATFTMDNGINCPAASGSLVIGVNAMIRFNRFWASSSPGVTFDGSVVPSSPQGAMTLSQFTEAHLHTIGSLTGVSVNFESDASTPDFSETVSPESYSVTLPAFSDIIRVAVPRNQARGRWIMTQVKHSQPYERFILAGLGYVFKDSSTFRTKARIT